MWDAVGKHEPRGCGRELELFFSLLRVLKRLVLLESVVEVQHELVVRRVVGDGQAESAETSFPSTQRA